MESIYVYNLPIYNYIIIIKVERSSKVFFFIDIKSPAIITISCLFICRLKKRLVETRLYKWQGFVANNSGGSPIRELEIRTYFRALPLLSVRATPSHRFNFYHANT